MLIGTSLSPTLPPTPQASDYMALNPPPIHQISQVLEMPCYCDRTNLFTHFRDAKSEAAKRSIKHSRQNAIRRVDHAGKAELAQQKQPQ